MTTILFSIPVHESNETIRDTIANVWQFCGLQHHIMLHVDANWSGFDPNIADHPQVHVNPLRWPTQHAHSQIATHLTNFWAARDLGVQFSHMAIMHTSELFVRGGMPEHIAATDHAIWFTPDTQPQHSHAWPPRDQAMAQGLFKSLFEPREASNYLGNIIEGSWWRRELLDEMLSWTLRHYDLVQLQVPWAAEECYFPTLAWHLSGGGYHKHPYCAFHHADHFLPNTELIDGIRSGEDVIYWQPHNFVYDYAPTSSAGLFSVKRLRRDADDALRCYIRQLGD